MKIVRRLLILLVWIALIDAGAISQGTDGNTTELDSLKAQVLAVAQSTGEDYIKGRVGLEELYRKNAKLFDQLQQNTDDWRVNLMCGIVAERANKAEEIQRFVKLEIKGYYSPFQDKWVHDVGEAIAKEGKDVPMLLVEAIWKGNEVKKIREDTYNIRSIIGAIGILGVKQSRGLLEEIITNDKINDNYIGNNSPIYLQGSHPSISCIAAYVLGNFGDPRSVPALCQMIESACVKKDSLEIWANAAVEAVLKCGNSESIPYLENKAKEAKNDLLARLFKSFIKDIKAKYQGNSGGPNEVKK